MSDGRYDGSPSVRVQDVLTALELGDPAVGRLLVEAALNDPDWEGVQNLCLDLLAGPDRPLAALAATGLGHLGRIHRTLHLERVVPALLSALRDPGTAGTADGALDDLEVFLGVIRPVLTPP